MFGSCPHYSQRRQKHTHGPDVRRAERGGLHSGSSSLTYSVVLLTQRWEPIKNG